MSFWKEFTSPIAPCGRLVLETSSDAHISQIPRDVPKDYQRARRTTPKADRRRTQEALGGAARATNIRFTSSYDWNHCAIETGWQPPSRHSGLYEIRHRHSPFVLPGEPPIHYQCVVKHHPT